MLHVFTSESAQLEAVCAASGLSDVVTARRFVDFLEYLNLATRFDTC